MTCGRIPIGHTGAYRELRGLPQNAALSFCLRDSRIALRAIHFHLRHSDGSNPDRFSSVSSGCGPIRTASRQRIPESVTPSASKIAAFLQPSTDAICNYGCYCIIIRGNVNGFMRILYIILNQMTFFSLSDMIYMTKIGYADRKGNGRKNGDGDSVCFV